LGDFVLDREDVPELAVEALRPAMEAARDLDQLYRDAQAIAGLAHTALDDRAHTQLVTHVRKIHPGPAEAERGTARGDAQPLDVAQGVDELLSEAFAKIVLVAPRTHVGEG